MMRAMFAAIGGLRNHITFMDVVSNNIANVNTAGFKSSRVTFKDMLSQTTAGASAPTANLGGTNPVQVGLGMTLGGIDVMHQQGALQATGKLTDFAVQGNGFFVLRDGARTFYTRDGAFDVSVSGELVNPTNGFKVMGWNANVATGQVDTTQPVAPIEIPFGQSIAAQESSLAEMVGNLDANAAVGAVVTSTVEIYDSLGNAHPVTLSFEKTAANTWDVTAAGDGTLVTGVTTTPAQIVFSATGALTTPDPTTTPFTPLVLDVTLDAALTGSNTPVSVDVDFRGVTQFGGESNVMTTFNNGFSAGALVSFTVGPSGDITGIFSNGTNRTIGQMALAGFTNPGGLLKSGANMYEESANSGTASVGTPGTGGRGQVGSGVLEASNTDLAREFTNVVIAQRGFQASSRIISTADEMLSDLVNLKR